MAMTVEDFDADEEAPSVNRKLSFKEPPTPAPAPAGPKPAGGGPKPAGVDPNTEKSIADDPENYAEDFEEVPEEDADDVDNGALDSDDDEAAGPATVPPLALPPVAATTAPAPGGPPAAAAPGAGSGRRTPRESLPPLPSGSLSARSRDGAPAAAAPKGVPLPAVTTSQPGQDVPGRPPTGRTPRGTPRGIGEPIPGIPAAVDRDAALAGAGVGTGAAPAPAGAAPAPPAPTGPPPHKDWELFPWPGARGSSLWAMYENAHRPSAYLSPQLVSNGLTYSDITHDPTNTLRQRYHLCTFAVRVVEARGVPSASNKVTILERKVRVCIFDGDHNVLSNIHAVLGKKTGEFTSLVHTVEKTREHWKFKRKGGYIEDDVHDNVFVVRLPETTDPKRRNLQILFELAVVYQKNSGPGSDEINEESCGWTVLPIYEANGKLVEHKGHTLPLHGGTPKEQNMALITEEEILAQKIPGWKLFKKPDRPVLKIKLGTLGRSRLHEAAFLPDHYVASLSSLPLYALYRHCQAQHLLQAQRAAPTISAHEPALEIFPALMDTPDLAEWLEAYWESRAKHFSWSQKKNLSYKMDVFREVVLEMWPLLHALDLAPFHIARPGVRKARYDYIEAYVQRTVNENLALNPQGILFEPFSIVEVAYDATAHL